MGYPIFTEDLLEYPPLVIWCPEESLVPELALMFEKNDLNWRSGIKFDASTSKWDDYCSETCYAIMSGHMLEYSGRGFYRACESQYGPIYEFTGVDTLRPVDVEDLL